MPGGKCDHDWVFFFLMADERKMEPMDLIIGVPPEECCTDRLIDGQFPYIDNSHPTVAFLMEPTQKCNKM